MHQKTLIAYCQTLLSVLSYAYTGLNDEKQTIITASLHIPPPLTTA